MLVSKPDVKQSGLLLASIALNLVLATVLVVLGWQRSSPAPTRFSPGLQSTSADQPVTEAPPGAIDQPAQPSPPVRFHWGLVESADYRQYIANLRAVGCPERLIRDIIIADVATLYAGKMSALNSVREDWQPWDGSDRRQVRNRERSTRVRALQAEQRALLRELLGIEWSEQWNELMHDGGIFALVLGFLPEEKPSQLVALIEEFSEASRQVDEKAKGILLEEDREQLVKLRRGMMTKFAALMSPAEFEELSLRAQSVGKLMEGDIHLDGVTLSGPEFRQLCGLSRITGDIIQDEILRNRNRKDLSDEEEEQRQKQFEAEVKKLLGPTRFADFQRAQQPEFRDAFEFTEEHRLPVSTAAKISDAMRNAQEQADEIKQNQSLSPDEQLAALTLLKSVTVNALSSALGPKYAEYARTKGTTLDDLIEVSSAPAEGRP
jgi:hypothetical protein